MRILITEAEYGLSDTLRSLLEKRGFAVDTAYDGVHGLDDALSKIYDLILLDAVLPESDGLTVLRKLRQEGVDTPVLLLMADGGVEARIQGLNWGADDCLARPFDMEELLARVRALVRRRERVLLAPEPVFGDLVLDREQLCLRRGEESIRLGAKEFQIMEYLMEGQGQMMSRQYLYERVWGLLSEAEYNGVEVYVSFLRRKLQALHSRVRIRSVRGGGYRLEVQEPPLRGGEER